MASWETQAVTTQIDVNAAANAAMEGRGATRAAAASGGGLGGVVQDIGQAVGATYSVVGINAAKVPEMREQIRTSVTNIQNHLDSIEAAAESNEAYKSANGEIRDAVVQYVESVKTYCKALVSNLLAFSDKLAEVEQAWQSSTSAMAGSVSSSTSGLSDNSTFYTETM